MRREAAANPCTPDLARRLYVSVRLIREVEERLRREYSSRNIRGPIHLSIGQEGLAAGVLVPSRRDDTCVSTHRNHAHYLAKGGSVSGMVDELYGLETGCSGGAAGSMHLFDSNVGMWGSSAIVGGSIPVAVGLALAHKLDGRDAVSIAFTGDGGTDEGVFYESLNLAALLGLPVLFVVEQNGLSTCTPFSARQAETDVLAKAAAFGVPGAHADGQDAIEVAEVSTDLLESVRRERRPRILEARTSRLCAHVGPGVSVDSPEGPYPDWGARRERDPMTVLRRRIEASFAELARELSRLDDEITAQVDRVFGDAKGGFERRNAVLRLEAPPPPNPSRV